MKADKLGQLCSRLEAFVTALRLLRGRLWTAALVALGSTAAIALTEGIGGAATTALPGDDLPFASATFRATHNSYSGNLGGTRGSIVSQLDAGVRFLELDIHDEGLQHHIVER